MKKAKDFWVGDRFVRPSLGEIQLGPERVHLEPRSMEVLLALASNPSEVILKKELIDAVWGDAFVSDEVLTHAIWDLRRAFGDQASDPEFIQTIPKKGYRLIAPVKAIEPQRRRATDRQPAAGDGTGNSPASRFSPALLWGMAVVALLVAITYWVVRRDPVDQGPVQPTSAMALVLVSAGAGNGSADLRLRLDQQLESALAGLADGVIVRSARSCEQIPSAATTYCLKPRLLPLSDGHRGNASLQNAATGELLYASPIHEVGSDEDLARFSNEISDLVAAFFEIQQDSYSRDSDIRPWISTHRNDPRAVRDFLLAMKYVYLHETGGRHAMDSAMKRDTNFVAPRVLSTPTILGEQNVAAVAAHRAKLASLRQDATAFEKAMIEWAIALIDDKLPVAIRQLWVALEANPGNRPVLNVLGALLIEQGDIERASQVFEELLGTHWRFPGLYPLAAHCAVLRGAFADFERALRLGEQVQPLDPETLAQLELLSIYEGNAARARSYRNQLEKRRQQMSPEIIDLSYRATTAEYLATRAETEGRHAVAGELRESAD